MSLCNRLGDRRLGVCCVRVMFGWSLYVLGLGNRAKTSPREPW